LAVKITWTKAPSCTDQETPCKTHLRVTAANKGNSPVKITEIGIRHPRKSRLEFETIERLGILLEPSEEASAYLDRDQINGLQRYDTIFAKDDTGVMYYPSIGLAAKISRFLWWRFGFKSMKD
jgi:hypothetical protein